MKPPIAPIASPLGPRNAPYLAPSAAQAVALPNLPNSDIPMSAANAPA